MQKTTGMDKKEYKKNLHEGSRASTFEHARGLRRTATDAEKKLWPFLRNRKLKGKKFRRQHAFADYILDFYCHECKLVVEPACRQASWIEAVMSLRPFSISKLQRPANLILKKYPN